MALGPALALVCGTLAGCLLELPSVCGDGQVDLAAEEECDPADEDGPPCDPATCKRMAVATCGDGKLDPGEQCDTTDFGNKDCPSGKGFLSCTAGCELDESTCDRCGDGHVDVDAGEECDPKAGTLLQPKDCSELQTYPLKPYTSGRMTTCTDRCLWYRGPCGYCGDNQVDDPQIVDINYPTQLSSLEVCDGEDVRLDELQNFCSEICPNQERGCTPTCDKCTDFVAPAADEDLHCCLPRNSPCPAASDPAPCCYAHTADLADPFSSEACQDRFLDGGLKTRVCK